MYNAEYNINNRQTIQKRHTAYLRNKRQTDPLYKLGASLRSRINKVINGEHKPRTLELLGCSYDFLKKWLEFQFKDDMTFENHGTIWHIDHIIPCKHFNLLDDEKKKCFNWSNLQPSNCRENISKGATIRKEEVEQNKKNIRNFMKIHNEENVILL